MADNKTFQIAFLISFLAHSVFFFGLPQMRLLPNIKPLENVTITYYKLKETVERKETVYKKAEPVVNRLPDIKKEEILNAPKTKTALKKAEKTEVSKSEPKKDIAVKDIGEVKEKRFENVVEEEKDTIKKSTYISYYKAVREKIKLYADRNYPIDKGLGNGDVLLCFLVASNGELLKVAVVDKDSVHDPLLRDIAINSIRDASPFPAFPKGMNQYQITFNVVISFEGK